MDTARERELAGLTQFAFEIKAAEVRVRVEGFDGNSTDRCIGETVFQETTCHGV
jgi:hypothetical protein